ncbi:winged helix-turn-helix domain-containing protein [Novosphingobium aureum]|nr:response regulator transcription factor [Novosphingobium aureum]
MADRRRFDDRLHTFTWLSKGEVPDLFDLRRCGWALREDESASISCIAMLAVTDACEPNWIDRADDYSVAARRRMIVGGVADGDKRAFLLAKGFGDVVTNDIHIEELGLRARRVAESLTKLPRIRSIGRLSLDLLEREAYCKETPLNLNPREFALLWRLTDNIDQSVSKQALIRDVWRLGFVPETNSIAVHMSRLRRKLAFGGLDNIIDTVSGGGYRLCASDLEAPGQPGSSMGQDRSARMHASENPSVGLGSFSANG